MKKSPFRRRKRTVYETREIQLDDEKSVSVELEWKFTRSYENDDADGNRGEWVNLWELVECSPVEDLTKEEEVLLDEAMGELECPETTPDGEPDPDIDKGE